MVKLLKQSSIPCTSGNTRGQRVTTKATTANPVNDIQTKISSLTGTSDNIAWNRKMTERMASGWMFGGWDEQSDSERRPRWCSCALIWKRRNANRGVERGLRGAKGMYEEENILRSDPRRDNAPSALWFLKLWTAGESIMKDDRRQKKCGDAEKFLEAVARKRGASR